MGRRHRWLVFVLVALLLLRPTEGAETAPQAPPSIVVILADDFGVGDIRALYPKNKIKTPHLDRLVSEGTNFTDAHSPSAVCTPTRYGLLTGRYAWRTRLQESVLGTYEPPLIAEDRPTLPGMLRQQGYRTACVGKWHLGWEWPGDPPNRMLEGKEREQQSFRRWDFEKPIRSGPITRGFDEYFGVDITNVPPFTFIKQDRLVELPTAKFRPDKNEGVYLPKNLNGTAAAPNWKLANILPTITKEATQFIATNAKQHKPFFLYFPLTSPHAPVVPSKEFRGKSGIAPIADFVMETDWSVGQILKAIDDAGIADNTIVIFTADNGHSSATGWRDLIAAGHHASGPYRGFKREIWEGGHRVPFIVRWPKQIAAGSSSNQLVSLTDLFATFAELTGAELPANGAEDSISFLPALLGKPTGGLRTTGVQHSSTGEFAYRDGPWKLVYRLGGKTLDESRGKPTVAELYNLSDDVAEKHNVAEKHPEIVDRMTTALRQVIDAGTSRTGQTAANDRLVRFDVTQAERWGPPTEPVKQSKE